METIYPSCFCLWVSIIYTEALLMSSHNVSFHGEIRKIYVDTPLLWIYEFKLFIIMLLGFQSKNHVSKTTILYPYKNIYSKTCVRRPPLKLILVVDVERWLSYKGTCHVILLAKLPDMYLCKTDNFFHINHYLKSVSKVALLHRFYCRLYNKKRP